MPTISPFGLDGNNNQSLSPFDIKGKGADYHTPPEYLRKTLNELLLCICSVLKCCLQKDVLQERTWLHTLYVTFLSSRLIHTSISHPSGNTQDRQNSFIPGIVGNQNRLLHDLDMKRSTWHRDKNNYQQNQPSDQHTLIYSTRKLLRNQTKDF